MLNYKASKVPPTEQVQQVFDANGMDWLRFAVGQYLIFAEPPKRISDLVKAAIHPNDSILVLEVEVERRSGWAPEVAVNWLNKYRP